MATNNLELVTGYWGIEHITAEQEADFIAGLLGTGAHVLPIGEQMRAEAVTANKVRIFDGAYVKYGRRCQIEEGKFEDVTIENGTAGMLRNDMIVIAYKRDESTGVEGIEFKVLKGQSSETTATDPTANDQDIRSGAFESELPFYRVRLNGLAIEAIEPLFSVSMSNEDIVAKFTELNGNYSTMESNVSTLQKKALQYRGIFTGDMNDLTIPFGIYQLGSQSSYTNGPSNTSYCIFVQFPDDFKSQLIVGRAEGVVTRRCSGSPANWTSWV